jgi:hypothetical protein
MTTGREVPDERTVASLALAFHRGDMEGAATILSNTSLPLLIAASFAWWNAVGIREHGPEEWDRRLVAFLQEAASQHDGEL